MDGINPALGPPDMQTASLKLDVVPAQTDQLGRPQAVAIGDQDRGGVPVAMAVVLGSLYKPLDLALSQIVPADCYSLFASNAPKPLPCFP